MKKPEPGTFVFDPDLGQEVTTVPHETVWSWGGAVCPNCAYFGNPVCNVRSCKDVIYLTKNDYLTAKILGKV